MAYNPAAINAVLSAFGAVGDGVTDDTDAIQAAINYSANNGLPIFGEQGKTYLLSHQRTQSGVKTALIFKSGMYFDLNGATLKMSDGQGHCSVAQGRNFTTDTLDSIYFGNGWVDGNCQNQIVIPGGIPSPTLYLNFLTNSKILQLKMKNTIFFGLYCSGTDSTLYDNEIDDFFLDTSLGGGFLAVGKRWRIGRFSALNCAYFDTNSQGNPFIASFTDSTVDSIYVNNFGYGVKLQDGASRVTIGKITAIGGANNILALERGVKLQGGAGIQQLYDISIGEIICQNIPTTGLSITDATRVSIGSYTGSNNSFINSIAVFDRVDCLISNTSDVSIGSIISNDFSYICLGTNPFTGSVKIGRLAARTTKTSLETGCGLLLTGGQISIDQFEFTNSGVAKVICYTDFPDGVTNPDHWLRIGHASLNIDTDLYFAVSPVSFFQSLSPDQVEITKLSLAGSVNQFPTVTLRPNETTTSVATKAICYNSSDFGPVLNCSAVDTDAIAIAGVSGRFLVVPSAMSVGGGFVIIHPSDPNPGTAIVWVDRYHTLFYGPEN